MVQSSLDTVEFTVACDLRIAEDVLNLLQMACFGSHNGSSDALDPDQVHGLRIVVAGKRRAQNEKPVQSRRYNSETPEFRVVVDLLFRHTFQKYVQLSLASDCVAPYDGGLF